MSYLRRLALSQRDFFALYAVLAVFIVAYYGLSPSLLTIGTLSNLSMQIMPLVVVSMAQGVIMLTGSGGPDLSIGSAVSLTTVVSAVTMTNSGIGILKAVLATLAVGVAIGLVNGSIVAYGRLPSIIVTLATMYLWQGIALLILSKPGGHIAAGFSNWVNASSVVPAGVILIVAALIAWKYIENTSFGPAIYAVGDNAYGAFVSNIKTRRTRVLAYALAGAFVALAGIGLAGRTGTGDPNIGNPYLLNSITAAVIGGISFLGGQGKIMGTVIGGIILGLLTNILFFSEISTFSQYIVQGVILILVVGLRSIGPRREGATA